MRNIKIFTLLFVIPFFLEAQIDRSIKPEPAAAPEINIGQFEEFTLDNGLKVFVVENSKFPLPL